MEGLKDRQRRKQEERQERRWNRQEVIQHLLLLIKGSKLLFR